MTKEKETKKEVKMCLICKMGINPDNEFAEFIHYKKEGEVFTNGYYHVQCFRDRLNGGKALRALQAKADLLMNKAAERLM